MKYRVRSSPKLFKTSKGEYTIKNYRLAEARVERGMRGEDLALLLKIPTPTFYSYESLKSFPPIEIQERIAKSLGKEREYLFPEELKEHTNRTMKSQDVYDNLNRVEDFDFDNLVSRDDSPEKTLEATSLRQTILDVLETLLPQEKQVIRLIHGLEDGFYYTYREIGLMLGVSRSIIGQVEWSAFRKLREPVRAKILLSLYDQYFTSHP